MYALGILDISELFPSILYPMKMLEPLNSKTTALLIARIMAPKPNVKELCSKEWEDVFNQGGRIAVENKTEWENMFEAQENNSSFP